NSGSRCRDSLCSKRWLKYTGSPMSRIDKAEFRNEKCIDSYTFSDFKVRH
ncbi:hypothetical protein L9F63_000293, partial [Diploptera punctata]